VSSILKALKRVEKAESPNTEPPIWPSPVPHLGKGDGRWKGGVISKWMGGLLLVTLFLGVTWLSWKYLGNRAVSDHQDKKIQEPLNKTEATASNPAAPATSAVPAHTPVHTPQEKSVRSATPPAASDKLNPDPGKSHESHVSQAPLSNTPPAARKNEPPAPVQRENTPVAPSSPAPNANTQSDTGPMESLPQTPPPQPLMSETSTEEGPPQPQEEKSSSLEPQPQVEKGSAIEPTPKVPEKKSEETDVRIENAKPLKEGRLTLQAIAWSSIPEKRMVVISNEVLKQGGNVQGFEVVRIQENSVVLKEKGQLRSLGYAK